MTAATIPNTGPAGYPVDRWPALALGLLLTAESLTVPCLKPKRYQKRMRAALREVQAMGWRMAHHRGTFSLSPAARRAALRDGGTDWAGAALADMVLRRDGAVVQLGKVVTQ